MCCWPKDSHMMIILNNLSSPGFILSMMKYCGLIPTLYTHLSFHPQRTELHIQQHPEHMHAYTRSTHAHTGSLYTLTIKKYRRLTVFSTSRCRCADVFKPNIYIMKILDIEVRHIQHFCNSGQYLCLWWTFPAGSSGKLDPPRC